LLAALSVVGAAAAGRAVAIGVLIFSALLIVLLTVLVVLLIIAAVIAVILFHDFTSFKYCDIILRKIRRFYSLLKKY